jgi:hypothetical protein
MEDLGYWMTRLDVSSVGRKEGWGARMTRLELLLGYTTCTPSQFRLGRHPRMMRIARERVGLPGPVGEVVILSGDDADTLGDNLDENEDCKIYCLDLSP